MLYGRRDGLIAISKNVTFGPDVRIRVGKAAWLGPGAVFQGTGDVRIGKSTYVGAYASINCMHAVTIGDRCMLGNFVSLIDNDHGTSGTSALQSQPLASAPIVVRDDCWLGEKATVLRGVTIGEGAVVAAGSVVRRDVPPYTLVAGVPARIVRTLD